MLSFRVRLWVLILGSLSGSVGCQTTPSAQPPAKPEAQATAVLPALEPLQILQKMQEQYKSELKSVHNYALVTEEDLTIYARRKEGGEDLTLESRTTNRVMPGRQRKIWLGNQFEIWNRGGIATAKDLTGLAKLFTLQPAEFVDGTQCYVLKVDRKSLFEHPDGIRFFDDNRTTGSAPIRLYVDPQNWLIRQIASESEQNGKPIHVRITWKRPVRFSGLAFWEMRETVVSGEGIHLTSEQRQQLNTILAEMRQNLADIDAGKMNVPPESMEQARDAIQHDIERMELKMRNLAQGRDVEIIILTSIRVNQGYPKEIFE